MKANYFLSFSAGAAALVFLLTGSKCISTTEYPPYKPEICTDQIDNDEDKLIDCQDPDCQGSCKAKVSIDSITSPVMADSLIVTGKQSHAVSITVTVSPSGFADSTILKGENWQVKLTRISIAGQYRVMAQAKDSSSTFTNATATFTRK